MKYKAKPITLDGHRFASRAEAARYIFLVTEEDSGNIHGLELQPRFDLGAGIKYVADFRYYIGKEVVVEDVKGFRAPVFVLKAKLFKAKFGFPIKEVKMPANLIGPLIQGYIGQQMRERIQA